MRINKNSRQDLATVVFWVVVLSLFVLSGCAYKLAGGYRGCVLCDFVPTSGSSPSGSIPNPLVIRAGPAVRFNGRAVVSLDGSLRNLQGEIFQALLSACGITPVEAKDTYGWDTVTAHDYGVDMRVSTSYDAGIGTAYVSVLVSRAQFEYQRRDYVFLKSGSGAATYGASYGPYGVRRVGVYPTSDIAMRVASAAAIANLCGGTVSYSPAGERQIPTPEDMPAACEPPDCYERTFSISGTWGGPGIYSYGARPAYAPLTHGHNRGSHGNRGVRR